MHPSGEYAASPPASKDIFSPFRSKLVKLKDSEVVAEGNVTKKKIMENMKRLEERSL